MKKELKERVEKSHVNSHMANESNNTLKTGRNIKHCMSLVTCLD